MNRSSVSVHFSRSSVLRCQFIFPVLRCQFIFPTKRPINELTPLFLTIIPSKHATSYRKHDVVSDVATLTDYAEHTE